MAVQAQHVSRAFHHHLHSYRSARLRISVSRSLLKRAIELTILRSSLLKHGKHRKARQHRLLRRTCGASTAQDVISYSYRNLDRKKPLSAISSALEDGATGASLFLDERGGCAPAMAGIGNAMPSNVPRSDLTCSDNNHNYAFVPRTRARVVAAAAPGLMDEQPRGVGTAAAAQGFVPVAVGDMASRSMGSGVASTSGMIGIGHADGLSQGILYNQGMEIDALVRVETERMRAGLDEAWRRHVRALVAAAERAAAVRLRAAEATLEVARCRNAEMEERLRQIGAEGQAWVGVAQSHEAVAAGLRATLDQLLQSPCAAGEGDAEDVQSCCFETSACGTAGADDAASIASAACRACGQGGACVLVLPCRHLSLCRAYDASVDTCPVCAATKNASLHVLLC
ncbi:uncharacterized protein LOC124672149 [Lolium rigidum]|uniref:uncharacterized protein LOC124672149 n=1 Tax=Lolium rigidum TaxID=89674 RepID=UPI001F5C968C|nr:uncharacterized protein LOC124672149 [Lolium rigidum]